MADVHGVGAGKRRHMIAEAAYFRAEARGFDNGDPTSDWLEAEREVDRELHGQGPQWLRQLESQLANGRRKLAKLKKSVGEKGKAARAEWKKDIEKLDDALDTFEGKVKDLRGRGEAATQKARQQAVKIGEEVAELVHRLGGRHS